MGEGVKTQTPPFFYEPKLEPMNKIFSEVLEITMIQTHKNQLLIVYLDGQNNEVTLQFDTFEFFNTFCDKKSIENMQSELIKHIKNLPSDI